MDRIALIREKLTTALQPEELIINDESHLHKGHAGSRDGKGHFALSIRASSLNGKSKLEQHQMIYKALGEVMKNEIHALSIKVL